MSEAAYDLSQFESDVQDASPPPQIEIEEIETQDAPAGQSVDIAAEIERTANKVTVWLAMGLNFVCTRKGWQSVQPDEFMDFKATIVELLELHPVLARGGRLLIYLDNLVMMPEFYARRMMFEGASSPENIAKHRESAAANTAETPPANENAL